MSNEKNNENEEKNEISNKESDISNTLNKIGDYIVKETLGEGAFGKVKLGIHIPTNEKVAIKILNKKKMLELSGDITKIQKEINILKKMRHKNIIQLYEILESKSNLFLVMEYCPKGELFDFIVKKKKLNEQTANKIFHNLIDGVEYMHSQNVVHRDLKPENLLLDEKYNLKISDFGLSTIYHGKISTPCGTPSYAPPEMLRGDPYVGLKSDIWSCGIILFAMLCGFLPFAESKEEIIMEKVMNRDYKIPDHLSIRAKDILSKLMEINPEKRINLKQIKEHPWFKLNEPILRPGILIGTHQIPIDETILNKVLELPTIQVFVMNNNDNLVKNEEINISIDQINNDQKKPSLIFKDKNHLKIHIIQKLKDNKFDNFTASYYLLLKKYINSGGSSVSDLQSKAYLNYIKDPSNLIDVSSIIYAETAVKGDSKIKFSPRRIKNMIKKDSNTSNVETKKKLNYESTKMTSITISSKNKTDDSSNDINTELKDLNSTNEIQKNNLTENYNKLVSNNEKSNIKTAIITNRNRKNNNSSINSKNEYFITDTSITIDKIVSPNKSKISSVKDLSKLENKVIKSAVNDKKNYSTFRDKIENKSCKDNKKNNSSIVKNSVPSTTKNQITGNSNIKMSCIDLNLSSIDNKSNIINKINENKENKENKTNSVKNSYTKNQANNISSVHDKNSQEAIIEIISEKLALKRLKSYLPKPEINTPKVYSNINENTDNIEKNNNSSINNNNVTLKRTKKMKQRLIDVINSTLISEFNRNRISKISNRSYSEHKENIKNHLTESLHKYSNKNSFIEVFQEVGSKYKEFIKNQIDQKKINLKFVDEVNLAVDNRELIKIESDTNVVLEKLTKNNNLIVDNSGTGLKENSTNKQGYNQSIFKKINIKLSNINNENYVKTEPTIKAYKNFYNLNFTNKRNNKIRNSFDYSENISDTGSYSIRSNYNSKLDNHKFSGKTFDNRLLNHSVNNIDSDNGNITDCKVKKCNLENKSKNNSKTMNVCNNSKINSMNEKSNIDMDKKRCYSINSQDKAIMKISKKDYNINTLRNNQFRKVKIINKNQKFRDISAVYNSEFEYESSSEKNTSFKAKINDDTDLNNLNSNKKQIKKIIKKTVPKGKIDIIDLVKSSNVPQDKQIFNEINVSTSSKFESKRVLENESLPNKKLFSFKKETEKKDNLTQKTNKNISHLSSNTPNIIKSLNTSINKNKI